jgi:hypothetical protein
MTSLEPLTQPDPEETPKSPHKKMTAAAMIGGWPGTAIAILTALTGVIGAYTQHQESQAIQRSSYDAIKEATDKNTAAIEKLSDEFRQHRMWTTGSLARAVRELQQQSRVPVQPVDPKPAVPLDIPTPEPLPNFDQLKKD